MRGLVNWVLGSGRWVEAYKRLRALAGVGWVAGWASRMAFPANATRWVVVQRGMGQGLALLVYPRYELAFVRGDHEPAVQDLLSAWLRPGDIFFDVGAHVGFFSLIAARFVGPRGSVFAFEPDPDNFARFQANVARNRMDWVSATSVVVSDRHGVVAFARSSPASSRMEGTAAFGDAMTAAEKLTVQSVALDDHYDPREGIVKIDVEGGEVLVLKGAPRLLLRGNLRWIVEAHTPELEAAVVEVFREANYSWRVVNASRITRSSDASPRYVIAAREQQSLIPISSEL